MTPEGWALIIGAGGLAVTQIISSYFSGRKLIAVAADVKQELTTAATDVKRDLTAVTEAQIQDNKKKLELLTTIHEATNGGWAEAKRKLDRALEEIVQLNREVQELKVINRHLMESARRTQE